MNNIGKQMYDMDAYIAVKVIKINNQYQYNVVIGTDNYDIELVLNPDDWENNHTAYIKSRLEELQRYEQRL